MRDLVSFELKACKLRFYRLRFERGFPGVAPARCDYRQVREDMQIPVIGR